MVGRWQPNSVEPVERRLDRRLLCVRSRLYRSRGFELRQPVSRAGPGGDRDQHPHRHASEPRSPSKGEFRPDGYGDRGGPLLVRRDRLQARRDSPTRTASTAPQQYFLSNQKEGAHRNPVPADSICASPALTIALGGRACRRSSTHRASESRPVRSEHHAQHRRLHVQRIPLQRRRSACRSPAASSRTMVKGSVPDLFVDDSVNIWRERKFTPVERRHRLSAGSARRSRRQRHRAICRARAARAGAAVARRARGDRDFRYRQSEPRRPKSRKSVEIGLRRNKGPWRFELTGFYTRFNGFIYRNLTGQTCDDDFRELRARQCRRAASRRSIRSATRSSAAPNSRRSIDVAPIWRGVWGIDGRYDIVRATFTDGSNVPRIPPQRLGGGVYYRDGQLVRARRAAARLRAEQRLGFRDRDRRLQSAEGRDSAIRRNCRAIPPV